MKITICGSIDFSPEIIEIKKKLEAIEYEVNIPLFTQKIFDGELNFEEYMASKRKNGGDIIMRESQKVDLIRRYWDYIMNSDAILVLNLTKKGIQNYIGGNTLIEMGFAYGHKRKIFLYNPIPIRSAEMHYVDEILNMNPIILYGNLDLIPKVLQRNDNKII